MRVQIYWSHSTEDDTTADNMIRDHRGRNRSTHSVSRYSNPSILQSSLDPPLLRFLLLTPSLPLALPLAVPLPPRSCPKSRPERMPRDRKNKELSASYLCRDR